MFWEMKWFTSGVAGITKTKTHTVFHYTYDVSIVNSKQQNKYVLILIKFKYCITTLSNIQLYLHIYKKSKA